MEVFYLTVNKPAIRMFFSNKDHRGLKIALTPRGLRIQGVEHSGGVDIAPFDSRGRGGGKAIIEGNQSKELFSWFTQSSHTGPYFILRSHDGWISVEPYLGVGAPSKFVPHLRVWAPKSLPRPLGPGGINAVRIDTDLRKALGDANNVVVEWWHNPRRRKTDQVDEALELLRSFWALYEEFPQREELSA